jgi:hypothetical protein
MGDVKCLQKFWSGNLKGRGQLEDLSVDGKITLKVGFKEITRMGGCGLD